jgi:hypothetical protein
MSKESKSSGRPKRGKATTLSHQLDDIAAGVTRVPSRRAGAGARLNAILDAVKHNGSIPDATEAPQGPKKSVSLPSTPIVRVNFRPESTNFTHFIIFRDLFWDPGVYRWPLSNFGRVPQVSFS